MRPFQPSAPMQQFLALLNRLVLSPPNAAFALVLPPEPSDQLELAFYRNAIVPMYQRVTALLHPSSAPSSVPAADYGGSTGGGAP
jgi:hypothetical protein